MKTCKTCKHCDRGFCNELQVVLDGYALTCSAYARKNYTLRQEKALASSEFIMSVLHRKHQFEKAEARVIDLESVGSPVLSEKITGSSSSNGLDNKAINRIDAIRDYIMWKSVYEHDYAFYDSISKHIAIEEKELLDQFYFNEKSAKSLAKKYEINLRTFYQKKDTALAHLYPYLQDEYKRLAEIG